MRKKRGKNKNTRNLAGKILIIAQLIFSAVLLITVGSSKLLPAKYMFILFLSLLLPLIFAFGLQSRKRKIRFLGVMISVIFCIGSALVTLEFLKVNKFLDKVSGAEYKIDDMVVVVRSDDPAQDLEDTSGYVFGIQTIADKEDTEFMCLQIEKETGEEPRIKEYFTPQEAAKALLEGEEIDAVIYNSAFTPLIEDSIEGYSDRVRVIHRYEIKKALDINIDKEYEFIREREEKNPFNVYVSGIDVRGPVSVTSRSDANIIITVNPNTRHILLTTTPRDYYVPIPEISQGKPDKLTHAGIYGVDASMRALQELYGIDLTYYARVNFTSFIHIVNTLGGIDVNSEYSFRAGGYYFEKGMNHMDGNMALTFARERHSFASGDNQRGKNQEAVLAAIINKALSPAILKNADRILANVSESVETNMTRDEMAQFIKDQLEDDSPWSIESQATAGKTGARKPCYSCGSRPLWVMIPDEEAVAASSERIRGVMEEKEGEQE